MYHINSTEYERSFWDAMKRKNPTYNGLSQGRHRMTNSYALPTAQGKQFMAAMITSIIENSAKILEYTQECQRLNIQILPPDINKSFSDL